MQAASLTEHRYWYIKVRAIWHSRCNRALRSSLLHLAPLGSRWAELRGHVLAVDWWASLDHWACHARHHTTGRGRPAVPGAAATAVSTWAGVVAGLMRHQSLSSSSSLACPPPQSSALSAALAQMHRSCPRLVYKTHPAAGSYHHHVGQLTGSGPAHMMLCP